jgi:fructose-1,6-bisphosphatase I
MESLNDFLHRSNTPSPLVSVLNDLMHACIDISKNIQEGALTDSLGQTEQQNIQGETQKLLDVISNNILKEILSANAHVKGIASEEEDTPISCQNSGQYLVLFDPLDGSSNIDINVTVGTIFSILACNESQKKIDATSYLQTGQQQISAGYVLYGPSTMLVLTTGNGTHTFTLNPNSKQFLLVKENISVPKNTQEFAINMSNQRFWTPPIKNYVSDLLLGEEGPLGKRYNMRWVASMVAEIHRILTRGGIFMYPYDSREPNKPGKLRLMYEGNPMSMLIEQAGGKASTSSENIMQVTPTQIHQRVSVIMGSANEVDQAVRYHNNN